MNKRIKLALLAPSLLAFPACHETIEMDFSLAYYASEGGEIVDAWNDIQVVYRGKDGNPVTAVPHAGYVFVAWSDGINTAQRQDKNVQAHIAVTAYFELEGA